MLQTRADQDAIVLDSVTKTYAKRNSTPITSVNNLSLGIPKGQVLGFLGPNGAGKTTTIKMICGLVTPSSGQILVNGIDLARKRSQVMLQIGAVLEGTRNIYWRLSAWQNLTYFGRLKGCPTAQVHERGERLLREFDLWDRRDDMIGHFSRGMQQKVAIICALIHDPPIILLDEPTLGLDVQAARTVRAWINSLAREHGKTILLTSHELPMVQEVCDRVAIISKGKLVADKPVSDLLAVFREERYEIKIGAHLDHTDTPHLSGLTTRPHDDGMILSGPLSDQADLHRLLAHLHNLRVPLISVNLVEPTLEDVFVYLTNTNGEGHEHVVAGSAERSL